MHNPVSIKVIPIGDIALKAVVSPSCLRHKPRHNNVYIGVSANFQPDFHIELFTNLHFARSIHDNPRSDPDAQYSTHRPDQTEDYKARQNEINYEASVQAWSPRLEGKSLDARGSVPTLPCTKAAALNGKKCTSTNRKRQANLSSRTTSPSKDIVCPPKTTTEAIPCL